MFSTDWSGDLVVAWKFILALWKMQRQLVGAAAIGLQLEAGGEPAKQHTRSIRVSTYYTVPLNVNV